jgi:hypothetical protein
MNQLAMWASLFKIWQRDDDPDFTYSRGKMSHYFGHGANMGAHDYARAHSAALLKTESEKEAMESWIKTGALPINLHYPHVMIHANMGQGGVDGVAFRADMDRTKDPFMCHNTWDRHKFPSCNAQASMCTLPEQCTC